MIEQVKLYDVGHFRHLIFDGFFQVGETVYNCDCGKRIIKHGKAPCELLARLAKWFTIEDAERDLRCLGFKQLNEVEWEK